MKEESWFLALENSLDQKADDKTLHLEQGLAEIETYKEELINMLYAINNADKETKIEDLEYKPLNAAERFWYISQQKYHFMRYQQMKTLRQELKKLNAVKKLREKRSKL